MPVYEFKCKGCNENFRALRQRDDITGVECPSCGTKRVARLLSVTAPVAAAPEPQCCGAGGGYCCAGEPSACGCRN